MNHSKNDKELISQFLKLAPEHVKRETYEDVVRIMHAIEKHLNEKPKCQHCRKIFRSA